MRYIAAKQSGANSHLDVGEKNKAASGFFK